MGIGPRQVPLLQRDGAEGQPALPRLRRYGGVQAVSGKWHAGRQAVPTLLDRALTLNHPTRDMGHHRIHPAESPAMTEQPIFRILPCNPGRGVPETTGQRG